METACGCHDDECHVEADAVTLRLGERLVAGLRYAFTDLYDEIVWWLVLGLVVAGAVVTFVSPSLLAEIGSGLPAKLLMFLIGIPMYICATASTPLAASLLFAGVSPGTVLVFLLAGPATNLGTVGIIRREFGQRILVTYLATLAVFTIGAGLLTDVIVDALDVDIAAQLHERQHLLPLWLQLSAVLLLVLFAVPRLRTPLIDLFSRPATR